MLNFFFHFGQIVNLIHFIPENSKIDYHVYEKTLQPKEQEFNCTSEQEKIPFSP